MITFTLKESLARYKAEKLMALRGGIVNDLEVIVELVKLSHQRNEPIEFKRLDSKYINGRLVHEMTVLSREQIQSYLESDFHIDFRTSSPNKP
jgi:RNA polymerase-interacting CarD/CdnL/TRCF family regulator